jgi:hypothetical protein
MTFSFCKSNRKDTCLKSKPRLDLVWNCALLLTNLYLYFTNYIINVFRLYLWLFFKFVFRFYLLVDEYIEKQNRSLTPSHRLLNNFCWKTISFVFRLFFDWTYLTRLFQPILSNRPDSNIAQTCTHILYGALFNKIQLFI